jgi:hypothetical protein
MVAGRIILQPKLNEIMRGFIQVFGRFTSDSLLSYWHSCQLQRSPEAMFTGSLFGTSRPPKYYRDRMETFAFLIPLIAAIALPLVFKNRLLVRIAAVFILWLFVYIFIIFRLNLIHRLTVIHGREQLNLKPDEELPAAFILADQIHHQLLLYMLPFCVLVFVAFSIIALTPFTKRHHLQAS